MNNVPKELIIQRNNYFDDRITQIKTCIKTFDEQVKDIDVKVLKQMVSQIYSSFIETYFLSQMLYQESKELCTLKEFLACELAKTCFENCELSSERENTREQLNAAQRVKEYLLMKSTNLELKIHDLTCENANVNEQKRVSEFKVKSLEESLTENQTYTKMLEEKLTKMYTEYKENKKNCHAMNIENKKISKGAKQVYDILAE